MLSLVVCTIQLGGAAAERGPHGALGLSGGPWSPAPRKTAMGHCHPPHGYTSCFLRNRLKAPHGSRAAVLPATHGFSGKNGNFPSRYASAGPQHETSATPIAEVLLTSCREKQKNNLNKREILCCLTPFISVLPP